VGPFDHHPGNGGALDPAANPFHPGAGLVPPSLGGRERETAMYGAMLRRVAAGRPATSGFLEGPRGIGKTALMAMLAESARDARHARPVIPLELEVRDNDPALLTGEALDALRRVAPSKRLRELADRLTGVHVGNAGVRLAQADRPEATLASLIVDLGTTASEVGKAVMVLVDEAHEGPDAVAAVVRGLHRAGQRRAPMAAVIAGLPGTAARIADKVTYAERLPTTVLDLLDRGGVDDAIRKPLEAHDVGVDDDVIDRVHDATGGYPYFVQVWGEALWNATADPGRVDADACARAELSARDTTDRFHQRRYDALTCREREYVAALAARHGRARTADVAADVGLAATSAAALRDGLLKAGVVYAPARGEVALTVPPMAGWLRAIE
jgi:hypothetical protein